MNDETESILTLLPAWKNAASAVEAGRYAFGDVIPRCALEELFGLPEPKAPTSMEAVKKWQLAMLSNTKAFADYLLETHCMCLASEFGVGYRILHPHEQTEFAQKQGTRELHRELNKMARRIHFVDRNQLSAEQRKFNADAAARTAAMASSLRTIERGKLPDVPKRISASKGKRRSKQTKVKP